MTLEQVHGFQSGSNEAATMDIDGEQSDDLSMTSNDEQPDYLSMTSDDEPESDFDSRTAPSAANYPTASAWVVIALKKDSSISNGYNHRSLFDFNNITMPGRDETEINKVHIATALIALKSKYHLSNKCIEDILSLLRLFSENNPSSYKALCTVLRKRSFTHLTPTTNTICPHCGKVSPHLRKCTACDVDYSPIAVSAIPLFYTYDIGSQIEAILATSPHISFNDGASPGAYMNDITHGNMYKSLLAKEASRFLTLSMNVDGIQPNKGSDQSLWRILMVVNEINRKKRFSLENLIIAGMWPGPSKPSRPEISLFFQNAVKDLKVLEQGRRFDLHKTDEDDDQFIKIFLIASCCDKPAQCLVQCLSEPTAFFGCGFCEIQDWLFYLFSNVRILF